MRQTERTIIGIALAGICPLLTFVLAWWTAVAVHWQVPNFSENAIKVTALSGLLLGIVMDLLLLRRWMQQFYTASPWLMGALHAALCVGATAFFMGLPVGTFGVGITAGVYAGRRQHHAASEVATVRRGLRQVALFAAFLTAGAAFAVGLLVLQDESVIQFLGRLTGLAPDAVRGGGGVILVGFLTAALFAAQYVCSLQAGWLAFRMGDRLPPEAP